MECNKDDALRAKEIAEKKFLAKDFSGAKKLALKAQNLNPELEGISQMLATFSVHVAAQNKVNNGEGNFYGILGVSPKADDESIRKQYRKLALMLHPDKNKSIGAEAAFKHVSEAWSLLSDKNKKTLYDNRNASAFQQRAANADSSSTQNGFHNFAKNAAAAAAAASRARPPKGNKKSTSSSGKQDQSGTFWTVCMRCKMQYEYARMYLNHNLLCPNCHEAFFAVETTAPSNSSKKSNSQKMKKDVSRNSSSAPNVAGSSTNFEWCPFTAGGHASAAQAANVVQQAYQKVKRERQQAQAATKREEALKRKNRSSKRPRETLSAGEFNAYKRKTGIDDPSTRRASTASPAEVKWGCSEKEVFHRDIRTLLMEKAKKEIQTKLSEPGDIILTKKAKESKNEENHCSESDVREDHDTTETKIFIRRCDSVSFDNCLGNEAAVECISVDVPESEFHNFDSYRMESCFRPNQVWAAYDDCDGMPRYYAMILEVISLNPCKARISWLNSNINCINSVDPRSCGYFRRGRNEIRNSINCFSHLVRWSKGPDGDTIQIFPRKGEVWALYKNWSPEWDEFTEDGVKQKYDLFEVLEDFNEEGGVVVTPLVKVAGFKAVFHKHLNPKEMRKIPRDEMSRFSHQISSHLLTGKEGPKAPKGCLELDPAAMPAKLLEVIQVPEETECTDVEGNREENQTDVQEVIILDS